MMIDQKLWIATSAVVVTLTVRAINTDGMGEVLSSFAGKTVVIPPVALRWLALLFGMLSAVLNAVVNGATWQNALAGGFVSSATAAFGYSLTKTVPGLRRVVMGRFSRAAVFLFLMVGSAAAGASSGGCKGPTSPTTDADASGVVVNVEAGIATVDNGCEFFSGLDPSGVVRTICATVEEFVTLIGPYIATLFAMTDVGAPLCTDNPGANDPKIVPHTNVCASSAQRAQAILYLANVRAARFMLDGGR